MSKKRDAASLVRFVAKVKAVWDLYWRAVVPGAIYLNGVIKERRARKRKKKGDKEDPPRKEHPRTVRLRRELEREKKKRESERLDSKE